MSFKHIEVDPHHDVVTITLATGEKVRIYPGDDGLGITNHSIRIVCDQTMYVRPHADNAATITTPKAQERLRGLLAEVVRTRNSK